MHPIVNIGVNAARAAGRIINQGLERLDKVTTNTKAPNDFVTNIDLKAEEVIIETIQKAYPDHGILAEESGVTNGHEYQWIIDPLDGTTNFVHGFPHFSISLAVKHEGRLEHAVVYDPVRDDLFVASRGQGARMNNQRIRVAEASNLEGALLGTGFPFKHKEQLPFYLETFSSLFPKVAGIRRAGSAALDLAYVAAGRLDGYWEIGLSEWDIAAGVLLVKEAGGFVGDFNGGETHLETGNIVAGNLKVFKNILQEIKPSLEHL